MAQLDPSRYRQLTQTSHTYGVSCGLYWDTTNSKLVLAVNDAVVAQIDATGITADLEVSGESQGDILRRGASSWERLSAKTSGQVLVGDGTDIASVAVSGDVALTGGGVATVTDLTITNEARGDLLRRGASAWERVAAKTADYVLVGDGTDITSAPLANSILAKPRVRCVTETLTAASLTDGGAAEGTKTLTASIPAGALFLYATLDTLTGFAGDVSAVITLGDGTDADRYNTGTPDIFTTAAAGVALGAPSGTAFHATAKTVVATVTSNADITPVLAGGGSCELKFWFLEPV